VSYFYHQLLSRLFRGGRGQVSLPVFWPQTRTREAAITMLADGAEATVRSNRPATLEDLERLVDESIRARVLSGQLDDCPLTLEDLSAVQQAFVDVLRGLQHPRITYLQKPCQRRQRPQVREMGFGRGSSWHRGGA